MAIRRNSGLALSIVGIAILLALPALGLPSFWVFFICLVGITAILTTSLNLAMGVTGLVSMVHTGLYAAGAYFSALLVMRLGLSFWLALPLAVVASGALGALISLGTLRAAHLYFAMITMAFNLILQETAQEWHSVTGGVVGLFGIPRPILAGRPLDTTGYYYLVAAAFVLTVLVVRQIMNSGFGRAFRAVKLREEAAMALGVNPLAARTLSFTISAGLAGLAGALFAHLNGFISPAAAGLEGSLTLFIALLLGGSGTLVGPLLGVAFVSVLQKVIQPWAQYQQFIFGAILLLTMFLIPKGLLGTLQALRFRAVGLGTTRLASSPEPPALALPSPLTSTAASGEMTNWAITARQVHKRFGGLIALHGVDLAVLRGSIHGLIGPNGSGKTTLVGVVTGYLRSDGGEVNVLDRPSRPPAHQVTRRGVARVFQLPHLFGDMTVLDNLLAGFHLHVRQRLWQVMLGLPAYRHEERTLRKQAIGLLRSVAMADVAFLPAGKLPHGQQRLLEVLRALALGPRIVILDEPTTGLTALEQEHLAGIIRALQTRGVTVLLIEHNMPFVMNLCETVTVLEEGRKLAEGTPAVVQSDLNVIEAYLGRRSPEAVTHA